MSKYISSCNVKHRSNRGQIILPLQLAGPASLRPGLAGQPAIKERDPLYFLGQKVGFDMGFLFIVYVLKTAFFFIMKLSPGVCRGDLQHAFTEGGGDSKGTYQINKAR